MVGRKRWKCNCDWISSASRSIEVAVRKLTGAPGSRSLGQPFHRSNPTIENSVASGVYSSPRLQRWTLHPIFGYFRVINHHAFPSFLHLVFFPPSSPIIYRIAANLTPPTAHIFLPNSNIQIAISRIFIRRYLDSLWEDPKIGNNLN